MIIEIKKVKLDPAQNKKIEIKYNLRHKDGKEDEYHVLSSEEPHPDLRRALEHLHLDFLFLCELSETFTSSDVTLRSVTFSWNSGIMGAVLSGGIELSSSNTPLNLNTPHKSAESYSDNPDDIQVFSPVTVNRLHDLLNEVKEFLEGKRAQGDLFEQMDEQEKAFLRSVKAEAEGQYVHGDFLA